MPEVTLTGGGPWVPRASESKSALRSPAEAGRQPQARAGRALCRSPWGRSVGCQQPRGPGRARPSRPRQGRWEARLTPALALAWQLFAKPRFFGESEDPCFIPGSGNFWTFILGFVWWPFAHIRKPGEERQHSDRRPRSGDGAGKSDFPCVVCPDSGQSWMTVWVVPSGALAYRIVSDVLLTVTSSGSTFSGFISAH